MKHWPVIISPLSVDKIIYVDADQVVRADLLELWEHDLQGKKIATSYPNTVKEYLRKNNISAELHIINGSVEIAPNIGLADAICDIAITQTAWGGHWLCRREIVL